MKRMIIGIVLMLVGLIGKAIFFYLNTKAHIYSLEADITFAVFCIGCALLLWSVYSRLFHKANSNNQPE